MSDNNVLELKEKRAKIITDARVVVDGAVGRDLTEDEQGQFDALMTQGDEIKDQIETAERKQRLHNAEQNLKTSKRATVPTPMGAWNQPQKAQPNEDVVRQWLLSGTKYFNPSPDTFRNATDCGINFQSNNLTLETRDQLKGTSTLGGYTVPTGFGDKIIEHVKAVCELRQYSTTLNTASGQQIDYPINDDTANEGTIVAEAGATSPTDTTFSTKSLKAYKYSAAFKISLELLQDSAFDLESYLSRQLGLRIGRKQARDFAVGNGSGLPTGIVFSADTNVPAWTPTYANLLTLQHSLDPVYRTGAIWIMHDTILASIRGLVDTTGRPLVVNNLQEDSNVNSLLGWPVVVCNDMAATGAGAKVIVAANMTDFVIRDVGSVDLYKADQLYIANGMVAFYAFARADSNWFGSTLAIGAGALA